MTVNHSTKADELRSIAEDKRTIADALDALADTLADAGAIGDTQLSGAFHECRTTGDDVTVSTFINVENGEPVVDHVSKLREGRWTPETRDQYDAILNLPTRPFMDSEEFTRIATEQLQRQARQIRQNADQYEERAGTQQHLADSEH